MTWSGWATWPPTSRNAPSPLIAQPPLQLWDIPHLAQLTGAMVRESLDALLHRDAGLAQRVLLSDDAVDHLRDGMYRSLIGSMGQDVAAVPSAMQLLFVVRDLERIADHATNIAEDVLFYLQGVDVRHRAYLAS